MNNILYLVPTINKEAFKRHYFIDAPGYSCKGTKVYIDPNKKKTSVADMKNWIDTVLPKILEVFNIDVIVACDSGYFKTLTKKTKAEPYLGYACKSYVNIPTFYCPSPDSIFYDPDKVIKSINYVTSQVRDYCDGVYKSPGSEIDFSKSRYFLNTQKEEIINALKEYFNEPILSCDIETFSLKHYDSGIASITFCKNKEEGIAFQIDSNNLTRNEDIRAILKDFLSHYKGTLVFHNIAFDAYILVYQLWMNKLTDTEGLLQGLEVMLKNWEDTKLITYLATNSCSGNNLHLKYLSQEFAGNYAQEEIGDISKIPIDTLLKYNLTDGLATWFVYEKYYQKMVDDNQLDIYQNIFKPATKDIIQMQLTGLPISPSKLEEVKTKLYKDEKEALDKINNSPYVDSFNEILRNEYVDKKNKTLKTKKITIEDAKDIVFNVNSNKQLSKLLYEYLELPIIETTTTKQPSTSGDTIEALINHTNSEPVKELLRAMIDYFAVVKINTAFIPAFDRAPEEDGTKWLFGNFNLGGTVSGRLSSNNPNMQNLPATGSKYAKLIKNIFVAPKGWLFIGLDFNALEDHISALTTKDKNKLKVYTDNYDGHCLRAYSYFKDRMPDITEKLKGIEEGSKEYVDIINSIKKSHKDLRQLSKTPTFALTYAGTYITLMKKCGFNKETALHIEKQYHELYKESDEWVKRHIEQARKDGYLTCAFGLRVRTPLLKQTIGNNRVNPKEADAEARTGGNALGQSYCLLSTRAGIEFNSMVRENQKTRLTIRPCGAIHDALYFLVKEDIDTVLWVNHNLVKCVQWQEDPIIAHPDVHLGGNLSIFYPDWAHELEIPNDCSREQLINLCKTHKESL